MSRAVRPYAGWILIGFGALVMLIGYFGVSRESIPAKQIPYLVSGGIGGVFLAVLGAYFLGHPGDPATTAVASIGSSEWSRSCTWRSSGAPMHLRWPLAS